jgi:CheY-like chemotaxis protein
LNPTWDEDPPFSSQFPRLDQSAETSDETIRSILLIEDNSADVLLVQQALQEHDVRAALTVLRDGEEAMRFIDAVEGGFMNCPDLIVLDINLPKKSGYEVLGRMRSSGKCAHVPVVVLSSSTAFADMLESKRLGVVRHIQKPTDLEAFLRIGGVLKSLLGGGQS